MSRDKRDKKKSHTPADMKNQLLLSKMKKKADEYDTYGTHVANQLRQIEDRKKMASVRFKIDEIICNAICESQSKSYKDNSGRSLSTAVEESKKKLN